MKKYQVQPGQNDGLLGTGALLLSRFTSLEDFAKVVNIQYAGNLVSESGITESVPQVRLTYRSGGYEITSELKQGVSQTDFQKARNGNLWDRAVLVLNCPFVLMHSKDLKAIENLGRRRPPIFGKGDSAFYDLASSMVMHIIEDDRQLMTEADLSEKGYLNTFNHITAQAFMTSIFSEEIADFVADVHELYNMPELITGKFTSQELTDFENGPVDNYLDMINNEFGQELGKHLKEKYKISRKTIWSPALLSNYLNDIQSYHSWAFRIGFKPFRSQDELVIQFSWKINKVLEGNRR